MTASERFGGELIEVLACDIGARPKAAPTIFDVAPHIVSVERGVGSLRIAFAAEAARDVEAFAEAERTCCAGIEWHVERGPAEVVLTIGATEGQLDALERMFAQA